MRRLLFIAALCLLAFASTGCKKAQLRRQLYSIIDRRIDFPKEVVCVSNGRVYPLPDSVRRKAKMIIYIDSSECHTCRLSHLFEYDKLFQLSQKEKCFEFVFMLGNTHFGGITLSQYLSDLELPYPVCIDVNGVFFRSNAFIPKDTRFHSLFVNAEDHVVFVGDPIVNQRVMPMLQKVVSNVN